MASMAPSPAELLASVAPAALRAQLLRVAGLDAKLLESYARGRAAWPDFEVPLEAWVRQVARHLTPQVERGLEQLHADLYFAVALLMEQPPALERFAALLRPKLLAQLRRSGATQGPAEDALAAIEERLLVAGPTGARLEQYSGRGPLERFLRAVTANELLNRSRGPRPEPLTDVVVARLADTAKTPELAAVSRDARRVFVQALHDAVRSLDPKERLLLRLHAVEGATIDELGRLFGVHKVTAFRWLEEARLRLRKATWRQLTDAHSLDARDVESLLGASLSTFDLSLRTLFASG